jgi:6-phosphofructokinase
MQLADLICKRSELQKDYGVILVPEGLIEFIPEVKKLISEINEILSKPFTQDIRDYVTHHLSY